MSQINLQHLESIGYLYILKYGLDELGFGFCLGALAKAFNLKLKTLYRKIYFLRKHLDISSSGL